MARKSKSPPTQSGLFGADVTCPDLHNLPLILEPRGAYEVFAPGSVYQPVLLTPGNPGSTSVPANWMPTKNSLSAT